MRPKIVLSSSSSGSKWLMACIERAAVGGRVRYVKEYFNPVVNLRHERLLSIGFGSEQVQHYRNIAFPAQRQQDILDVIRQETWEKEAVPWTVTKDNYAAWKVAWFVRHFDAMVLVRDRSYTFPPERNRVAGWYNSVYASIQEWASYLPEPVRKRFEVLHPLALTFADRAEAAHDISVRMLLHEADRYRLPVLDYHHLLTDSRERILDRLAGTWCAEVCDLEQLAGEIVGTRRFADECTFKPMWNSTLTIWRHDESGRKQAAIER